MGSGSSTSARVATTVGKYHHKTTSDDICNEYGTSLAGKTVIITGANSGIGLEAAKTMAKHGAEVIMACRSAERAEEAMKIILKENPRAKLVFMLLDLASMESVWTFCMAFRRSGRLLHIIINNAAAPICPKSLTKDGIEQQYAVNHIGHFILTLELMDILIYSSSSKMPGRVINISSFTNAFFAPAQGINPKDTTQNDLDMFERHGATKLANILFTRELARRFKEKNIPCIAVSVHPGIVQGTKVTKKLMRLSFASSFMAALMKRRGAVNKVLSEPRKNIKQGAATMLYCAVAPIAELKSGAHYNNCQPDESMLHPLANNEEKMQELWKHSILTTGVRDL